MTELGSRFMSWASGIFGRMGGAGRMQGAAEGGLPVRTSIKPWCGWL
jgi:hypothetical protein